MYPHIPYEFADLFKSTLSQMAGKQLIHQSYINRDFWISWPKKIVGIQNYELRQLVRNISLLLTSLFETIISYFQNNGASSKSRPPGNQQPRALISKSRAATVPPQPAPAPVNTNRPSTSKAATVAVISRPRTSASATVENARNKKAQVNNINRPHLFIFRMPSNATNIISHLETTAQWRKTGYEE